jgi:Arylmalonate decarboxylase
MQAKIGFLSPSLPSSSHIKRLRTITPKDIEIIFEQLILHDGDLQDVEGKLDLVISKAVALTENHQWDGLIFPGAPREVLNPELFQRLSSALAIPVATALRSSVAALRAFSANQILLLTPFDESLNKLICDFLLSQGIKAVSPAESLRHYTDALRLTSDDVAALTKKAFSQHPDVAAIYFQGAVLDAVEILEKLENDLKVPIVASNPAMLWFMLSKLGLKYSIQGYGKLLSVWPALPE